MSIENPLLKHDCLLYSNQKFCPKLHTRCRFQEFHESCCFHISPHLASPLRATQESVNGGFQTVVRVFWGNEIPIPSFYLNLTSFLPHFYLFLTSFLPFSNLNLTSASSRISNHGLETMVYRLLGNALSHAIFKDGFCQSLHFDKSGLYAWPCCSLHSIVDQSSLGCIMQFLPGST